MVCSIYIKNVTVVSLSPVPCCLAADWMQWWHQELYMDPRSSLEHQLPSVVFTASVHVNSPESYLYRLCFVKLFKKLLLSRPPEISEKTLHCTCWHALLPSPLLGPYSPAALSRLEPTYLLDSLMKALDMNSLSPGPEASLSTVNKLTHRHSDCVFIPLLCLTVTSAQNPD